MPSNPTYPGPFGHTWDEHEHRRSAPARAEDDEPIELPLERRWPAVAIASAVIIALGAGLLLIHRTLTRPSLGPTEELPMRPREFEPGPAPSPSWLRVRPAAIEAPGSPASPPAEIATSEPAAKPAPPKAAPLRGSPRGPDRERRVVAPPEPRAVDGHEQAGGFDFGSASSLLPPEEPALDPNDLNPRAASPVGQPTSDDLPDADVPDADVPDADFPDADLPDPAPERPAEESPDYSPSLGF